MSDPMREVVELAYDRGYYEVPRRCTLRDLAVEVGVSAAAVANRLQRAERHAIERVLGTHAPRDLAMGVVLGVPT